MKVGQNDEKWWNSRSILKVKPVEFGNKLDLGCKGKKRKESKMTPSVLDWVNRRMKLPLTEMGKKIEGTCFGEEIRFRF